MKHILLLLLVAALNVSVAKADEPSIERTDIMTGLQQPWELAFTPDGNALFTERCHRELLLITAKELFGTKVGNIYHSYPIYQARLPEIRQAAEET